MAVTKKAIDPKERRMLRLKKKQLASIKRKKVAKLKDKKLEEQECCGECCTCEECKKRGPL